MAFITIDRPIRVKTVVRCNHCKLSKKHNVRRRKESDGVFHVGLYCPNCDTLHRLIKQTPAVLAMLRRKKIIE